MFLLFPTPYEAALLLGDPVGRSLLHGEPVRVEFESHAIDVALCGFGLAAAGGGAAHWLARLAAEPRADLPDAVLIGLAGSYDIERAPVGAALVATAVQCDGIGIGEGLEFQNAERAGWMQGIPLRGDPPCGDRLILAVPAALRQSGMLQGELLSVSAASGGVVQAERRAEHHPAALAEDMETYAVALSARLAGCEVAVIRAIGNRAGDRHKPHWRTEKAMAAARERLLDLLEVAAR